MSSQDLRNTRRHAIEPLESMALMFEEFNELTPLPPAFLSSKENTIPTDINKSFEALTISGLLFDKKINLYKDI